MPGIGFIFAMAGLVQKKGRRLLHATILALLLVVASETGFSTAAPSPPEPGLRLLRADAGRLVLEWAAPPVQVTALGNGTVAVTAGDWPPTDRPGLPRLPFASTLIAVPPGTTPSLRLLWAEATTVPLPGPLPLAPQPEGALWDETGHPIGPAFAPADPLPAPSAPVVLEDLGVLRGVRLARVVFYPALPEGDRLRVYRRVRAEVEFVPRPTSSGFTATPGGDRGWVEEIVRRAVLNPRDALPAPPSLRPASSSGGGIAAFLEVDQPGLYRVGYDDLAGMGFGAADPRYLRLFRGDDEVACEWEGDDDALFEPGESLLFYAEPRFSRWTGVDAYRLVVGEAAGQRMASRSADPAGLPSSAPWVEQTFEENHIYTPNCFCGPLPSGWNGDRWVWEELKRPGSPVRSFPFQLPAVEAAAATQLTLRFIGYTSVMTANPDHRVEVVVNTTSLGLVEWDGKTAFTATFSLPPGLLTASNLLTLTLPGIPGVNVEGVWLDAFAVRYARSTAPVGGSVSFAGAAERRAYTVALAPSGPYRAYDVTDPLHPVRLSGFQENGHSITLGDPPGGGPRRYVVAAGSGIRSPRRVRAAEDLWGFHTAGGATGADYLIIAHPAFADALGPLIELRRSQGLSVAMVNVLGVYDAYGDGRPDPEAIRAFIADAYATWDPRPTFVLLVGDGSYDPRRYLPISPPTFIPPYLAEVDPAGGEAAADNRYVCVDGDDNLPDLLLGRLPVDSPEQAAAMVAKTVAYETDPLPGGWNARVLLAADDADYAGDFPKESDDHAAVYVADPFTVARRYCAGVERYKDDCSPEEAAALHTALLSDWNSGALLTQFTGHSSWQQWARERLFHLDDLPLLRNSQRYPVLAEMTCFTGAFHRPEPTLDEALVTRPDAGAVAAWGPTGLGSSTGHSRLSDGFFRAVFSDTVTTVGEATLAGKLNLASSGQNLDLLDTFSLLGDPALRLNRTLEPWAAQVYLPLVRREP